MNLWIQRVLIFIAGALFATFCIYWYLDEIRTPQLMENIKNQGGTQMANPASTHCISIGGTLDIVDTAQGQVGYCHVPDGRVCEEWSLFRDNSCTAPTQ